MRVESYLNVTPQEIANRHHNIWIGVSLGNAYFTKENLEHYIKWSIENTKDKVLVVIADALQAINFEVLDHRSPERASKKAMKIGDQKETEINEIIATLSHEDRTKVKVVRWKDILTNDTYKKNIKVIKEEFFSNPEFHMFITDIVKFGRQDRSERLSNMTSEELDRLSDYVLYELPHFVDGVQCCGDMLIYTVIPYPGLNKLDELAVGLSNKTMFPTLAEKLNVSHKIGIIEAYVE
jgi:tRNA-dependent cyclodipeptide synthase